MIDSTVEMESRPLIRRHNSCVDFTFLEVRADMNSQKLTRLNTLFERAADRKSGGIRQDKLARILPKGQITSLKYDAQLKSDKKDKKELRIISRGPFLAMFSQESVSFLNSLAVNERLERERKQRRHITQNQSIESRDVTQRERAQSAPSGMLRDISDLSSTDQKKSKKASSKKKKRKEQKSEFQHEKEKKPSNSKRRSKGTKEKKYTEGKEKKKKTKDKSRRRKSLSSGSSSSSSGKIRVKGKSINEPYEYNKTYKAETSENEASGCTLAVSDSSLEPPSDIKVSFHSSIDETKSSDFSDSFGEIMISNDPSFSHLSYSYSISEDEAENTENYNVDPYDENRTNVEDEKLCSFLKSLSFFLRRLVSKKGTFVSKDSADFNELARKASQSYPDIEGSNYIIPQTILTRPKSKLSGGEVSHPMNHDCPFRQSPSEVNRKSFNDNSHYKFVR